LSLSCLPLKPWSTLPKSVLLQNIPTLPSEFPMKCLIYTLLSESMQREIDRMRSEDDARARIMDQAKRLKRIEDDAEEQEAMNRLLMAAIGEDEGGGEITTTAQSKPTGAAT